MTKQTARLAYKFDTEFYFTLSLWGWYVNPNFHKGLSVEWNGILHRETLVGTLAMRCHRVQAKVLPQIWKWPENIGTNKGKWKGRPFQSFDGKSEKDLQQ